ncbi:hypothetical protein BLNAU_11477 [Blattamonas nauphoetae]|uniref:Uncharacterized protein n=1 Tax=Blattamonas nauphoetae TaxID=2049346 RepID=A0ABQ9XQJ2_9EUKA|nr:hypothetical protein BLNAU_11477 [Blattamonas nauphoetae]
MDGRRLRKTPLAMTFSHSHADEIKASEAKQGLSDLSCREAIRVGEKDEASGVEGRMDGDGRWDNFCPFSDVAEDGTNAERGKVGGERERRERKGEGRVEGMSDSNISSLLEVLQCDDEDIIVDTLRTLQKVAFESVAESGLDDSFDDWCRFISRLCCVPHSSALVVSIASYSLEVLYWVVPRDPPALTLLPSPIFPSPSPLQQYSGLSFLTALTKKLRIVFTNVQAKYLCLPSRLKRFTQLATDDQFIVTRSHFFCSYSFRIPLFLLLATPPIEVDSEIIREMILFVKEALTTILTTISSIDNLIASLPSDSSPTTPILSEDDIQMTRSLNRLRSWCVDFVNDGWKFFVNLSFEITEPHKSSFQTIVLDDLSFPDLILNSLKLSHKHIRSLVFMAISNPLTAFPWMRLQFITMNLVARMFETVDFVSLPLSESETLLKLADFIAWMMEPIGDDEEEHFEQYRLIRVSVFEPAKQFLTFVFDNSDKLILDKEDKAELESYLCYMNHHVKNMELRSDEYDADIVSELVKWEVRTMVEMENEENFERVFGSMLDRTREWNRDKRERQKRREVVLREEGRDDAFELRVVGLEVDTNQNIRDYAILFRIELALNADKL